VRRWLGARLGKAWCVWEERARESRRLQQAGRKVLLRWIQARLERGFMGWVGKTAEMKRLRQAGQVVI